MNSGNGIFTLADNLSGLRIQANGNLVAGSVRDQRDFLLDAIRRSKGKVVLNLRAAVEVDAAGIGLILQLCRACNSNRIPFAVEEVAPASMRVFHLFNLRKLFPIAATRELPGSSVT